MTQNNWEDVSILVGNGLGMALDSNNFSLNKALQDIWNNEVSNDEFKKFVEQYFPISTSSWKEDDLLKIHRFFDSVTRINELNIKFEHPLIDFKIFDLSKIYVEFIHKVVGRFFDYTIKNDKKDQFNKFISNFISFINSSFYNKRRINIFTTNYDKLLYGSILDAQDGPMGGTFKNSKMIDCFYRENSSGHPVFNAKNFHNHKHSHGVYIHLHGSPLFYEEMDVIRKFNRNDNLSEVKLKNIDSFKKNDNFISLNHLVLCSQFDKYRHIVGSPLLNEYFEIFKYRIRRSRKIILFGYGGEDIHINDILKKAKDATLYIFDNKEYGKDEKEWREKININNEDGMKFHLKESLLECDLSMLFDDNQ